MSYYELYQYLSSSVAHVPQPLDDFDLIFDRDIHGLELILLDLPELVKSYNSVLFELGEIVVHRHHLKKISNVLTIFIFFFVTLALELFFNLLQ